MNPNTLQGHMTATYIMLRYGMAVLAVALPFFLVIGGYVCADLRLQDSMSSYYHAGDGAMRDWFVGFLFAMGVFLMLYKGFTRFENGALNLAGFFLLNVAVFPMAWGCGDTCPRFSWHGTAAVLFFLAIAYVCIFRAKDTLGLIPDPDKAAAYRKIYQTMGWAMIATPAIALALNMFRQPDPGKGAYIFFVEAVGVIIFGFYWFVKSREIKETNAEHDAAEGHLKIYAYGAADMFRPITVTRVE